MTGLDHADLQPAGNAAAQEQLQAQEGPSSFGAEWYHWLPGIGPAAWAGEQAGAAWNDLCAQAWWYRYKAASETGRQELALNAWRDSSLQTNIDALSNEEAVKASEFRNELGEVLDYLQQFEMMRASGKTWEEMAQMQGAYMTAEARAEAEAANPGGAVTEAQIQEAHEESVADQDYLGPEDTSWWDSLTARQRARWNARGQAAITTWIAHAQRTHPELNVQASEVIVDIPGNSNSVAYVTGGKCYIGRETIEAIERDPFYADSTIMHELRGHPEFDTGFALSMELYDAAAPQMPGYTQPADGSDDRYAEWQRFEYFESEIGALMREEAWWVASRDLNGNGTIGANEENPLGAPQDLLDDLITNLSGQFAPALQGPFVKGLARRFEADPRVTPAASAMFASACQRLLGIRV